MIKKLNLLLLLLVHFSATAQWKDYQYQREIQPFENSWGRIELSDALYARAQRYPAEYRVICVTKDADTLEAPFVITEVYTEKQSINHVSRIINQSYEKGKFQTTLELDSIALARHIKLDFRNAKFQWNARLEGSQDLKNWELIGKDFPLVSIRTPKTNYQYTDLYFEPVRYKYFRIIIESDEEPELSSASIQHWKTRKIDQSSKLFQTLKQVDKNGETRVELAFNEPRRITSMNIDFLDTLPFYRSIQVMKLTDSVHVGDSTKEVFQSMKRSYVSSIENEPLNFGNQLIKKINLIIENEDNLPLTFEKAVAFSSPIYIDIRSVGQGNYFLLYSNKSASNPSYDLERFRKEIPSSIPELAVGKELKINQLKKEHKKADANWWIWLIIIPAVGLMGWFTVGMMKENKR